MEQKANRHLETEPVGTLMRKYAVPCVISLLAMTMSIYAKKQQAIKNRKKLGTIDERFLREGEALLFGELGVSLGIAPEEVPNYIQARISEQNSNRP